MVGDRTTTGGVIITSGAGSFMTVDDKPIALWGDVATCPACKSHGKIVGETHPIQTVNGVPVARHNDIVLCQCVKKPRVIALAAHHTVADDVTGTGYVGTSAGLHTAQAGMFDRHAQLLDQATGKPLAGVRYRLSWSGGEAEGITNASGHTMRIRADQAETATIHVLNEHEA
ncbi:hypothetical protein R76696_03140 [Ralstonia mannitolilytica]|nr:hypothetical protein R76696_03140 [Ralstonia mannitolilytica]